MKGAARSSAYVVVLPGASGGFQAVRGYDGECGCGTAVARIRFEAPSNSSTTTYTTDPDHWHTMSPTVHALRNEIRVSVDRFEREVSSAFTKEALAAICDAVDADIDTSGQPSKPAMRTAIRAAVDGLDGDSEDSGDSFRKADLQAIAEALRDDDQ